MTKTMEDYFADWENDAFGFGYGTGEPHIIPALACLLAACPEDGCLDHAKLEAVCGPTVAWLLINALCRVDVFEYGISPRHAWLTPNGKALQAFVGTVDADELIDMVSRDSDYTNCYRNACNCGPNGYEAGRKCANPFWGPS